MRERTPPGERVGPDGATVAELLERVGVGDQRAWDEIVDRYVGLVWSVARGYRLGSLTDDVVQTVWLRLAEHCDRIREPDRLGGWLATTTRNEALRVVKRQSRTTSVSAYEEIADPTILTIDETVADGDTLRHVLEAFAQLPPGDQELLRLLCAVPPLDYATIAEMIGRSIGSIGPTRDRCLKKLRRLLPAGLTDGGARPEHEGRDPR